MVALADGEGEHIAMRTSADAYRDPYASPHSPAPAGHPASRHALVSSRRFEPPNWQDVAFLLLAVVACWCLGQFAPPQWASGKSLTISRLIVALIGLLIGAICGYALLLRIGKRIYSAVIFGTLTQVDMALHQVDKCAEPGPVSALHLLRFRVANRRHTHLEEALRRPWTWCLLYFLFIFLLSNSAAFIFGRAVVITTAPQPQFDSYHPIPVLGEMTTDDLNYAALLGPYFDNVLDTWTLSSFAAIRVPSNVVFSVNGSDVSFTEATGALFSNTSVGAATSAWKAFLNQSTGIASDPLTDAVKSMTATDGGDPGNVPVSVVYPTWGSRVACTVARQGRMVINVDATGVANVVANVDLFDDLLARVGADAGLKGQVGTGGQVQSGNFSNNGVTTSFFSQPVDAGDSGNGFVSYDFVLSRLNTSAAPYGNFFTTEPGAGTSTIGIDAALCLTRISPYVVRTIDSAGVVALVEILSDGLSITDARLPAAKSLSPLFSNPTQTLSSTNKSRAYFNAFTNSRNQILKDNGRDFFYVANPTAVLMTAYSMNANVTPLAYGTLDPNALERVMNSMNARFLLPYLVGKGRVDGRAYIYSVKATAVVHLAWLGLLMGLILLSGLIGAFCIPKLPGDLPMRETAPSSWMALSGSVLKEPGSGGAGAGLQGLDHDDEESGPYHYHNGGAGVGGGNGDGYLQNAANAPPSQPSPNAAAAATSDKNWRQSKVRYSVMSPS